MRLLEDNISLFGITLLFAMLVTNCQGEGESNVITREIRFEKGAIHVEDRLLISSHFAVSDNDLSKMFDAGKVYSSNFLNSVKQLMHGDALQIEKCTPTYSRSMLDLVVVSKVVFTNSAKPALLNWVLTFGGTRPGLSGANPKQYHAQLLVIHHENQVLLLVPRLERTDTPMVEMPNHDHLTFDQFFAAGEPVRFESILVSGTKRQSILQWNPSSGSTESSSLKDASIKTLDAVYTMSGNDQLTLCTKLKIIKEGYYPIEPVDKKP